MKLPAWNIESEYPSVSSSLFSADEKRVEEILISIRTLCEKARPSAGSSEWTESPALVQTMQEISVLQQEAQVLLQNLACYVRCLLSVDATLSDAKTKDSQLTALGSNFAQTLKPSSLFLTRCTDDFFEKVISHPKLEGSRFLWQQERLKKDTLLSEKEETLVEALNPSGLQAWGDLYDSVSGTMRVKIEMNGKTEEMGLAQASALTRGRDGQSRKAAWQGIQQAWRLHEESAAAILNSLAGWRLEMNKKRSHTRPVDFMELPLFQNRIQQKTLDAMMTAVHNNVAEIRKAASLMAKMHGKSQLEPWDLLAPAPLSSAPKNLSFEEGVSQIRSAFLTVSPEFARFVDTMVDNRWIDAQVTPNRANGGYCTRFSKSHTPRVFMTYLGSNQDVSTLAHEIGHAYHGWLVKDLPLDQQDYPMTLAETASIFAETILADELEKNAKTKEEKMDFAWAHIESAVSLLLNIPARYEFENQFYQARKKKALSANELRDLTDKAWTKWYGDTLSENDKMFWASKGHFSFAEMSFYNFPYTFGYLFALSIYARRKELGAQFMPKYIEILRDTGRMTAEDLVLKHLNEDIGRPEFWQKSIDVVKEKIRGYPVPS